MVRHKRRWSVIYEGDVGSAWEWCQIKLHTSCDAPAPRGGLHGHETVHNTGVGPPVVPRGQVIHQQRCRAQHQVVPTISRLSWSGEFQ